jgi:hypothetical protein
MRCPVDKPALLLGDNPKKSPEIRRIIVITIKSSRRVKPPRRERDFEEEADMLKAYWIA